MEFKQWVRSIWQCYSLTSQSDWVSSISGEQPSLLPHGSFHQGFFYLDWPGPWPLSTDSPIRLQESITGALWRLKLNFNWVKFSLPLGLCVCFCTRVLSHSLPCMCAFWTIWKKVQPENLKKSLLDWHMKGDRFSVKYVSWTKCKFIFEALKKTYRICQSSSGANTSNSKTQEIKRTGHYAQNCSISWACRECHVYFSLHGRREITALGCLKRQTWKESPRVL